MSDVGSEVNLSSDRIYAGCIKEMHDIAGSSLHIDAEKLAL